MQNPSFTIDETMLTAIDELEVKTGKINGCCLWANFYFWFSLSALVCAVERQISRNESVTTTGR